MESYKNPNLSYYTHNLDLSIINHPPEGTVKAMF